jgi:hypothetical protein
MNFLDFYDVTGHVSLPLLRNAGDQFGNGGMPLALLFNARYKNSRVRPIF